MMHKLALPLSKERVILLAYAAGVIGVVGLYALLGMVRQGSPGALAPVRHAEVAVLVPLSGAQADVGKAVLRVVEQSVRTPPANVRPGNLAVTVSGYDTAGTPDGAANAAYRASLNPATIAVIGPLDARQVIAAVETLRDQKLAVLTPASTAPVLQVSRYSGLYRIPAPDDAQGRAIVEFLTQSLHRTDVFLIVEPSAYTRDILSTFTQAAQGRLRIAATLDLGQSSPPADIGQQLVDSQSNVVVYLGGLKNGRILVEAMSGASLALPVVGSDALNDPALLPVGNSVPVYYTSPILSLPAASDKESLATFRQVLGELANAPFACETAQATWFVLGALAQSLRQADQSPLLYSSQQARASIWHDLGQVAIALPGLTTGAVASFADGQKLPRTIYVYQVTSNAEWPLNRLVYAAREDKP